MATGNRRPIKKIAPRPKPPVETVELPEVEEVDLESEMEAETDSDMELVIGDDEDDDDGEFDVDAPDTAGQPVKVVEDEPPLDEVVELESDPEPDPEPPAPVETGPRVVYMRVPSDFLQQLAEMNFVSRQGIFFFNEDSVEVGAMARQTGVQEMYRVTIEPYNG